MAARKKTKLDEARRVLREVWGFDDFRPGQRRVIESILDGDDTLAVMPTGGGKSLCYQIPAIVLGGVTIVVSPLISLMHDQVDRLESEGVDAAFIDSTLDPSEMHRILDEVASKSSFLLYVSPERLQVGSFLAKALTWDVSLVAIDEAHCVSKWGASFRPEYSQIPLFIDNLKTRPVVAAFTATAARDTRRDMAEKLDLDDFTTIVSGFDRPNLELRVVHCGGDEDRFERVVDFITRHRDVSGIVYCVTKKAVEELTRLLIEDFGVDAVAYHAGLSDDDRDEAQRRFIEGDVNVVVATSAFGMGVDKPDVRYVLNVGLCSSLEDYYQNAGRAGRDGLDAACVLYASSNDIGLWKWMFNKSVESLPLSERGEELARRLNDFESMTRYAVTDQCLRRDILRYFEEDDVDFETCGNCSNCAKS